MMICTQKYKTNQLSTKTIWTETKAKNLKTQSFRTWRHAMCSAATMDFKKHLNKFSLSFMNYFYCFSAPDQQPNL